MNAKEFLKKNSLKESDIVEIAKGNTVFTGTLVPSKDPEFIALKLNSGYNTAIKLDKSVKAKRIGKGKNVKKAAAEKLKKNPKLPTISILHTGGTIASRVNYETGGVIAAFKAEDLLTMFPELREIANFESTLVSNMMSEDMDFAYYTKLVAAIGKEIKKGVRGIIIGHGTDVIGYTAAALSFALENCPIPVLIVGAQRSSDRGSSDAAMNLICAAKFIAETDFAGVAVCMHHSNSDDVCAILPGCKTRKMHTSRRDAFKAINDTPVALVDYKTNGIKFLKKDYMRRDSGKFRLIPKFVDKIGLLKSHPAMKLEEVEFFRKNKYKGLVIEGTGIGHTAITIKKQDDHQKAIKKLIDSGCIVCMTSQCLFGRVHPTIYTNTRKLSEIGVIYCEDMLPETAFVKLAWLLGNFKKEEVRKLMPKNLRGEINKRTEIQEPEEF